MDLQNYPLVSVITPTFNRADFLEETMLSILSQNYPNIEYIVLDDGSTDNTPQILSKYSNQIVWETHTNIGETGTVNKGYRMAKGKYIGIVNSDDLLMPGAIQAVVEEFSANPDLLVVYPGWIYIDENSIQLSEEFVPEYDYTDVVRKHWCVVGPGAFINRRALTLTHLRDEEIKYVADFEYWLRLGLFGPFKRAKGTYGTFRIHQSSTSVIMKNKAMALEHVRIMKKYFSLPNVPNYLKEGWIFREAWGRTYLHTARTCQKLSIEALYYYSKSVFIYPPIIINVVNDFVSNLMSLLRNLKLILQRKLKN